MAEAAAGLCFEDFSLNQVYVSGKHVVSSTDVAEFARITGDVNPLHFDLSESSKVGYERQLVHGLLSVSLAAGLLTPLGLFNGTIIGLVGLDQWVFRRPLFVGVEVFSRMTVVALRQSTSRPGVGILTRRLSLESDAEGVHVEGVATMLVKRRITGDCS